jgi:RNA polymerase sigma-70 factor (ECF subfamily)
LSRPFENIDDFEIIFKEYFNPLVNFVNKSINNFENSKEIVQTAFLKIWENRSVLEINTSVKGYIYKTVRNGMIDFLRKNKYQTNVIDLENTVVNDFPDDHDELLDPYIVRQAIEKALKNIKPKARKIFELNKFEGLTYDEIAEYMDISKRSVEDNVSKTLILLKAELKNHSELFD